MTKGEYRVGVSFNPSQDEMVTAIKEVAASFIDLVARIPDRGAEGQPVDPENSLERMRLKALAMTAIEEAAMWGVKAATKPNREVA